MTHADHNNIRALRGALGNFATGVTIVTAMSRQRGPVGVTINSFSSVSLTPPLVLWCLRTNAQSYEYFSGATHFCINVLAVTQQWLSNRFASQVSFDRFEGVDYQSGVSGTPVITGSSAWFLCEKDCIHLAGDHYIIIGRVLEFDVAERPALVFYKGRYASADPISHAGADDFITEFDFA